MAPPRKYHTEEERKAAEAARKRAWRAANPEKAAAQQAARYLVNREKILARNAAWKAKNPDKAADCSAAWYRANREKTQAANAAWRAENRDRAREYVRTWRAANPDKVKNIDNTRRARKKGSRPDLTAAQWREILEEFDNCCAYCQARGVKLEQEHMTPLSRGGRHTKSNIVPACRSCNAHKWSRTLFEFAALG
jgi:5-methylcytosine-specific restriction endonuclease McrA